MNTVDYKDWLHARLRDPELAAGYLKAHVTAENGVVDKELLALALRDIAEAYGITWAQLATGDAHEPTR